MSFPSDFSEIDLSLCQNNQSFYDILGVSPQSTQSQIRDAYRGKSKLCHPDIANIDKIEAAKQFQILNAAYDTLRFPEKRSQYDLWLRAKQAQSELQSPKSNPIRSPTSPTRFNSPPSSAFLGAEDRPLSPGEIFAVFLLGLTFLFCLLIAIFLGVSRGEMLVQSMPSDSSFIHQLESFKLIPKKQPDHSTPSQQESKESARSSKIVRKYSAAIQRSQQHPSSHSALFPIHASK